MAVRDGHILRVRRDKNNYERSIRAHTGDQILYAAARGICGEAASDIKLLPIFMGMGLDEFSVSPSLVLKLRRYMKKISTIEAKELSDKVLKLGDFETINKLLEDTLDYYQQTEK